MLYPLHYLDRVCRPRRGSRAVFGNVAAWGFGMAFPAVFLVLLRGMWKSFSASRLWFVNLFVASAVYLTVDGAWYVPAGTLSGLLSAYFWNGRK